ncbi:hypothetical protein Tco_1491965 [Tanacetum coccineum]
MKMKSEKSKAKGVTMQEPSESRTRVRVPPPQIDLKDMGKAKIVRLQAELDEEARLEREREEEASKAANIAEWDDVQAMIDEDYELATKLQAKEQGEISTEERSKLFVELMNERMKHFNMAGYTLQQLRGYSFDEIKTFFETPMRKVNTFVPIKSEVDRAVSELAAGSSKRVAEEELDQESSKRQKTSESSELAKEPRDKEADELSQEALKQMMIIVPDQGMNVEALQTKFNLEAIRFMWSASCVYIVGNRHLHAGREGVSIVKRNSYIDAGRKALGEDCWELKVFILSTAKPRVSTAQVTTASTNQLVLLEFSGEHSWPLEEVPLEITIGKGPFERIEVLNFAIVRYNSLHNLILGRTTMQKMGIVVSTIHRAVKFHTPEGVGIVLSTYEPDKTGEGQKKLKETSEEATKDILSCMNAVKEVVINDKYLDQTVIIGRQLPTSLKKRLQDLLKASTDIFAWTYADMTRIPRTIMVKFKRISLTGFRSCTIRSCYRSVTKQTTRSSTAELFDVDSGRISIVTVNTKDYHSGKYQKDNV